MSLRKFCLIFFSLIFALCCVSNSFAQLDEFSKAKRTIKPKAKPVAKKVDVTKTVMITRVEKRNRTTYRKTATGKTVKTVVRKPVVRKVKVPLLAAQLRLMLVNPDGTDQEVDPQAKFLPNDRLRLSFKTNQAGYLYVIRQRSPDEDGELIFPTMLVNNGSNLVKANYEYILPKNCPKAQIPDPINCSLSLFSIEEAPQEYFTLIFTRDRYVDLPNDAKNSRVNVKSLMSAGKIDVKTLVGLIEDSNQDLIAQQGDSQYAMRIVNVNAKDNEEIIETFVLDKSSK